MAGVAVALDARGSCRDVAVPLPLLTERGRVLEPLVESRADPSDVSRELGVGLCIGLGPRPSEADQLDPVLGAVAFEETGDVHLDALLGDAELRRDVLVGLARRDSAQDHLLSGGEGALDWHERKYTYFWPLRTAGNLRIARIATCNEASSWRK